MASAIGSIICGWRARSRCRRQRTWTGLLLGVIVLYWYLCLLGVRLNQPVYRAAVAGARGVSHFLLAVELVAMGHAAVLPTARRLAIWVRANLFARRPLPPAYQLRYHRFRSTAYLAQTG